MNANERRLAIRDYISEKRQTSIRELMQEFNASRSTIKRDLDEIAEIASFYGIPGKGGGIQAMDGWYASRNYLNPKQEAFLRKLSDGLQTEADQQMMESILAAFAMPRQVDE